MSRRSKVKSKHVLLSEIDDVLADIDLHLLQSSLLQCKEKVDRLMESAAHDCRTSGSFESGWPEGITFKEWMRSIGFSQDIKAERLCRGKCWNQESGRHLNCADALYYMPKDDYLGFDSPYTDSQEVDPTINNLNVLEDPVDGIIVGRYYIEVMQ